jgi:hypothetical protein
MSKRVSVPDFEEMLATKPSNIEIESEYEEINLSPESNNTKVDKTRSLDIYSQFSSPKPTQDRETKTTPISEILTTMFKGSKPETNQSIQDKKSSVNSIVENLQYIENAKKTIGEDNISANFEVVEQTVGVEAAYFAEAKIEKHSEAVEDKPFEGYPKLPQPVNEEQAVKIVRGLKLWAADIDLNIDTFPEYDNYFYVARNNSMTKIGNSYIVDKNTGKVYIVPASMPEAMSFKKVMNNLIKPVG